MYNALAGGNIDAVESEGDTLDVCLNHPSPTNDFHYHFWGACMVKGYGYWSDTEAPPLCRDTDDCVADPAAFTMAATAYGQSVYYSQSTWDSPIGLARDGHIVIGPYKSDGTTWGCADRDVCNGAFVNGSYVYVGSDTFPYVVGCWGPGPAPLYEPGCSSNGCGSIAADTTNTSSDSSSGGTSSTDAYGVEEGADKLSLAAAAASLSLLSISTMF